MLFPAVRHEVSFWYGGRWLDGHLVLPAGSGPHPLVLVVAGPASSDRDYSLWLDGLAAAGFASFTWRRSGASGRPADPWRRVVDHAREVLAATERLCFLPELDVDATAVAGWGEGGWAAAQAVTFSSEFRALVLLATPTAPPRGLIEHRIVQHLVGGGRAGTEVDAALDAVRGWLAGLAEGLSPGELQVALSAHRDQPWFADLCAAADVAEPPLGELGADPMPTLSAVDVPVLALFGEQDPTLPLAECVRGLGEALRGAGHVDHRVAVVRGGDRALHVRPAHGLGKLVEGRHQFGEWPAGLTETIAGWLGERLRTPVHLPAFVPPDATRTGTGTGTGTGYRRRRGGPVSTGRLPVRQVRRRISR